MIFRSEHKMRIHNFAREKLMFLVRWRWLDGWRCKWWYSMVLPPEMEQECQQLLICLYMEQLKMREQEMHASFNERYCRRWEYLMSFPWIVSVTFYNVERVCLYLSAMQLNHCCLRCFWRIPNYPTIGEFSTRVLYQSIAFPSKNKFCFILGFLSYRFAATKLLPSWSLFTAKECKLLMTSTKFMWQYWDLYNICKYVIHPSIRLSTQSSILFCSIQRNQSIFCIIFGNVSNHFAIHMRNENTLNINRAKTTNQPIEIQ